MPRSKKPPSPSNNEAARRVLQEQALRYFLEVVRTGSLTNAAEKLSVAPSAVSRQIARLEREMDTLLFERRSRGMVPNAAGELLAVHAKRSLQDIDQVTQEIQALQGVKAGTVRLASTEGFSTFLPTQIALFRRRYSHIRFVLDIPPLGEVTRMVREGETDIGITLSTTSERGIRVELRLPAPIFAVLAKDHPLAQQRRLSLSQLEPYPLTLPGPESTLRQLFDISCSRQGLQMEPVLLSRTLESMIVFAAAGGGIALCGEAALRSRLEQGNIVAVPLRDREMNERHFEVQTMAGRALPTACKTFLEHLQQGLQPKNSGRV